MKTERMVILLTPDQKAAIAERARQLRLSAGEVVRRAVEGYRPSEDEALLEALADELDRSVRETRRALLGATRQLAATRRGSQDRSRRLRKAA